MNGQGFVRIANEASAPFLKGLGFTMGTQSITGREYSAQFLSDTHTVVISYEPGDNFLVTFVARREDWNIPYMDDPLKVPRMGDLNRLYMHRVTKEEHIANKAVFKSVQTEDEQEKLLLKTAMDLRVVLPLYLGDHDSH